MTTQAGKPTYVRDGRTYDQGLLGGGLVDVVQGNPAAMAAANEYHDRLTNGFIAAIVGAVAMGVGAGWTVRDAAVDSTSSNQNFVAPMLVMLGGLVLIFGGTLYAASSEPYRWDAINMFNDGVGEQLQAPPRWLPAPTASLRMRQE